MMIKTINYKYGKNVKSIFFKKKNKTSFTYQLILKDKSNMSQKKKSVLFLCLGNICRSTMAEIGM